MHSYMPQLYPNSLLHYFFITLTGLTAAIENPQKKAQTVPIARAKDLSSMIRLYKILYEYLIVYYT